MAAGWSCSQRAGSHKAPGGVILKALCETRTFVCSSSRKGYLAQDPVGV